MKIPKFWLVMPDPDVSLSIIKKTSSVESDSALDADTSMYVVSASVQRAAPAALAVSSSKSALKDPDPPKPENSNESEPEKTDGSCAYRLSDNIINDNNGFMGTIVGPPGFEPGTDGL